MIGIHVDDLLIIVNNVKIVQELQKSLKYKCTPQTGSIVNYLGSRYTVTKEGVYEDYETYITNVAKDYGVTGQPKKSPPNTSNYTRSDNTVNPTDYMSLVGKIMYVIVHGRPDLSVQIGKLARHMQAPCQADWKMAMLVLRYLYTTRKIKILCNRKTR